MNEIAKGYSDSKRFDDAIALLKVAVEPHPKSPNVATEIFLLESSVGTPRRLLRRGAPTTHSLDLSAQGEFLRWFHCSLFIVHLSFVMAGFAPFHNDK
jgi:hypothetical protein